MNMISSFILIFAMKHPYHRMIREWDLMKEFKICFLLSDLMQYTTGERVISFGFLAQG